MNYRYLFLFLALSFQNVWTQNLSSQAQISVVTIGPGASLNDAFGHNVFRILDRANDLDVGYDYGRFPFDEPGFYLNFAQGKLNYSIGKSKYNDIKDFYIWQNRTIKEQVLNLSSEEKQAIFDYLKNNYKPENREYLYDFFYNNCATKIRDVLQVVTNKEIIFPEPDNFQPQTFRSLIREKVPTNLWGSVGIDLALGSVIDQQATAQEHMFLPDYIHVFFSEATLGSKKLVSSEKIIYQEKPTEASLDILWSPFVVFTIIGLLIIGITYSDFKKQKRSKILDTILLISTMLIGIMVLLLWFATDHQTTAQNYNLLWAFPLNGILAWQIAKRQPKAWVIPFLKFLVIILALMSFHWTIGVQVFAPALIPLLLALLMRYLFLINYFNRKLNV
ncbi:DUF4105 domain-containing protein [Bizionia argentinensis JUB59]|uniref:DUF4105 domain-containing protein n=1 Tax=Bizionia argentinensis JUB59 TaxID=1046627 RepID=G2EAU5_9FLAO|nr:DUF4105 domain-containing protein [Bizionia argentinensis]EGV44242.1 DUF4105 domain-containing protein [Bizionia argentinensis JUB59]